MNNKPVLKSNPLVGLLFISLLIGLLGLTSPAFSQNKFSLASFYNCTHEEPVIQAFHLMSQSSGEPSLAIILNTPIRIVFKDLKTLDKRVKNYDALSYMTANGKLIIFINEKHANAPAAALAAVLSHEAMHNDMQNSLAEEVAGWTREAQVWSELKQKDPSLALLKKGQYPLVDRLNVVESHYKDGSLPAFVRSRAGYQGLPETSPGFENTLTYHPGE